MILNIAICDDEKIHRDILKKYLVQTLNSESYSLIEFDSGENLLDNYPNNIDLLLLDIQMKSIDGFDLAKEIRTFDTSVHIIFTTAFEDFMQKGYEVRAFRYLLKPIQYNDFSKHILECINSISEEYKNFITVKESTSGQIIKIPISSILFVETISRFVLIHTDSYVYKSRINLNKIEDSLKGNNFFRCHRSYLINLNKVNCITKNSALIKDHEIFVSKYKIKELKIALTNVLGDLLC
ncbi:LytR/AlgR family response regulator transcription factor [Romboutsia lituseburensis]|uniref:LytR/AlgR family response regulator transcription factor n=1 Tax=Romboutsia lituseburensis TaxID=1537 RepID=UPI00215B3ED2|nr:LytTR family DNA-binding domain-containing protein [Romboutsia lituseburensis]MCR8745734.1 LytTR family DNA-binding domain-containing protein [Romboutsia lituseburensis]